MFRQKQNYPSIKFGMECMLVGISSLIPTGLSRIYHVFRLNFKQANMQYILEWNSQRINHMPIITLLRTRFFNPNENARSPQHLNNS